MLHHVMTRGIERRDIFLDDHDRRDLVLRLERLIPEWRGDCFAWCLMTNHMHLILRTGPQPLAKLMHRLNTGFAGRFNRRHGRVGHLFQNRYLTTVPVEEGDLLNQIRYVHLNPVRAGLIPDVGQLACQPWTGHGALVGARAPYRFERVDRTLSLFDTDLERARRALIEWMAAADGVDAGDALDFDYPRIELPRAEPRGKPPTAPMHVLEYLITDVCRSFAVSVAAMERGGRDRRESNARSAIAFVATSRLGLPISLLAERLGVTRQAIGRSLERGARIDAEYGPFGPREET